jgi:hypothetical protein
MKTEILSKSIIHLSAFIFLVMVAGLTFADDRKEDQKKEEQKKSEPASTPTVIYKPPMLGQPKIRVGGGTRRPGTDEASVLHVLSPDHTGLTTQPRPTLYWYAASPTAVRLEFSLISDEKFEPLLEIETDTQRVSGIQKLDLAEHDITLQPGVFYQWSVALIADENRRSTDVIASSIIKRIEPSAELTERIASSEGVERVAVYADEGIWYDALDSISSMITKAPQNKDLLAVRSSLLEQAGLSDVISR